MSLFFSDRRHYDPSLLTGIDPTAGLIPFDPPVPRRPRSDIDPNGLLAALGPPHPSIPTDPTALMALLSDLSARRQPSAPTPLGLAEAGPDLANGGPLGASPARPQGSDLTEPDIRRTIDQANRFASDMYGRYVDEKTKKPQSMETIDADRGAYNAYNQRLGAIIGSANLPATPAGTPAYPLQAHSAAIYLLGAAANAGLAGHLSPAVIEGVLKGTGPNARPFKLK